MAYAIAIFVGGVLGAASEGGFGLFVGGLLGWLLVRVSRQQRDIDALRASLSAPRAAAAAPAAPADAAAPEAAVRRQPAVAIACCAGARAIAGLACRAGRACRWQTRQRPLPMSASVDAPVPRARCARRRSERAGPDTVPMPEDAERRRPCRCNRLRRRSCAAVALRDAQAMAGRRQHHRQGRRRDPLRRPRLPRQVREPSTPTCRSSGAWRRSASPRSSCSASAGGCACRGPATRRCCRAARSRCST